MHISKIAETAEPLIVERGQSAEEAVALILRQFNHVFADANHQRCRTHHGHARFRLHGDVVRIGAGSIEDPRDEKVDGIPPGRKRQVQRGREGTGCAATEPNAPPPAAEMDENVTAIVGGVPPAGFVTRIRHGAGVQPINLAAGLALLLISNSTFIAMPSCQMMEESVFTTWTSSANTAFTSATQTTTPAAYHVSK